MADRNQEPGYKRQEPGTKILYLLMVVSSNVELVEEFVKSRILVAAQLMLDTRSSDILVQQLGTAGL
jgi:hypothetical protein